MAIHPTAVVDPGARLGAGVEVGPYAVVGAGVVLGDRCRVDHHASIEGPAEIGPDNHFFPFSAIGGRTQDLKYAGEPTHLRIGAGNRFREFTTVNRGTAPGAATVIGDDNLFLAYVHIAHDCRVGSHCVFSNNGTLAGHVVVDDHVILGGLSAVHQFCRIGRYGMVGGCSKIVQDVPPYCLADGNPATVRSLNLVGLRRHGFSTEQIRALRDAQRLLYDGNLNTTQALAKLEEEFPGNPEVSRLVEFVRTSERGIIR
ncbi:MAG: acyl-ACP--UDP-N-acetylglucosamine O-acyltransferase [Verrucomicrobium sp.]|nr:acyl-ACP--UDP-N-acetylglucosamine O-acyltransferase [Verrucomicrobium sp.]